MMPNGKRLRILFLPAWYPSEVNPVAGIFVKEHAKAASLYNDVIVLYAYPDPSPKFKGLCRISEDVEDGIRTIRVRYGGIPVHLWRKLRPKKQKPEGPTGSESKTGTLPRFLRLPLKLIGDLLYYWSLLTAFRKLIKGGWRPDIIHAHVFTAGVPAVLLGKLYRIPVVINERWSGFPLGKLTFLDKIKIKFAMNRARLILPTSRYLRDSIKTYGIKNRFKVIPNVINPKIFYPSPPHTDDKMDKNKTILLVASLRDVKGIPYLLRALSQLRQKRQDFVLDIVGDGPQKSQYEELAKKLGLDKIVRFHGLKLKEEVAQFMRSCDFFVQPSLQETFGVVYIEAMACGKPVIATNTGGPVETVSEEAGILVPPKDVKAIREAIEYMLDNYPKYSSERIARYTREEFGYETVGKMLDEVYRSTLNVK
jgi:glycosyltransferase involved in cell wall biosynthesis